MHLALLTRTRCRFTASPARAVHAALIRRLELLDPDLSQALHDAPERSHSSVHPWAISPLLGPLRHSGGYLEVEPDQIYWVRVTALVAEVLAALAVAFDPATSLGKEPLFLEHVSFDMVPQESRLESLSSYAALLTRARPHRRITLAFRSPTGFSSRQQPNIVPSPRLCIEGYLRKWNTFADVSCPRKSCWNMLMNP